MGKKSRCWSLFTAVIWTSASGTYLFRVSPWSVTMIAVMSSQIQMPTAPHPACLPLSLPATVINPMTAQTSRPNRGVRTRLGSPFSTCPTGRGILLLLYTNACWHPSGWAVNNTNIAFQAKGVLWDCLQGAFRRGDHRPSSLQALL